MDERNLGLLVVIALGVGLYLLLTLKPKYQLKKGDKVAFRRPIPPKVKQGTGAMVIETYKGWNGTVIKADVQLPEGKMFRMIPVGWLLKV
jgi:hypothetical protein